MTQPDPATSAASELGPRRLSRSATALAVLSVLALLTGGGWFFLRDGGYGPPAANDQSTNGAQRPGPGLSAASVRATQAGELLDQMVEAVETGNRTAYLGVADPDSGDAASIAAETYDNLAALPLGTFSLRYVSEEPLRLDRDRAEEIGDQAWVAAVEVTWQFEGFDTEPARLEQYFTFVRRGDRTYLVSDREALEPTERRPMWMTGPLDVAVADRTLVMVGRPRSVEADAPPNAFLPEAVEATELSGMAETGVDDVVAALPGGWDRTAVVLVPASQTDMESMLGAPAGSYERIAAVTTTVDGSRRETAPTRVVINAELFGRLDPLSAQIVVSHEITHVATDAAVSSLPLWLTEGFADYVAFAATTARPQEIAQRFLARVASDGIPSGLPGTEAFAADADELGESYEAAWLVCLLIAERYGRAQLLEFYRVAEESGVDQSFEQVLGTTDDEFAQVWQNYVADLAGV